MFRNYFMSGFAIVLLGIFSLPHQSVTTYTDASGSTKQGEGMHSQLKKLKNLTTTAKPNIHTKLPNLDKDKSLWDREAVGLLSLYQLDRKLAEFGLGTASFPPVTPPPVRIRKTGPIPEPVTSSNAGTKKLPKCSKAVSTPATKHPKAEAMIALVPDPTHTHLALYFDREIDSIQQALQDRPSRDAAGWIYTGQWLPWDPVPYAAAEEPVDRTNNRTFDLGMEVAPGVLIFRTNDFQKSTNRQFLLVYLVGESPTGGVNQEQFGNAVREWQRIENKKNTRPILRILGPNFSTSLLSLNDVLERFSCPNSSATCVDSVQIVSGTVSAAPEQIKSLTRISLAHFISLQENSVNSSERLLNYLEASEGIQRQDVALLSEDQTAFGEFGQSKDIHEDDEQSDAKRKTHESDSNHPLVLHFPREISQLRNAYEENSILKNAAPNQNSNAAKQSLDLNLEDSHQQEDDVPSFSNDQDAISEESTLSAITREMYNRHVRAVVLSATDTLDTIFVAQFLRRNLPNARIIVSDADLILTRAGEAQNFRGMLTVTTYPLIGNSVDWGGRFLEGANEHFGPYGTVLPDRMLPSADAVGIYNAMRVLDMSPLNLTNGKGKPTSVSKPGGLSLWLYGYDDIFHGGNSPALWLSAVGRGGFWPVAFLPRSDGKPDNSHDKPDPNNESSSSLPRILTNNTTRVGQRADEIPPGMLDPWARVRLSAACILVLIVVASAAFFRFATLEHHPQYRFGIQNTNSVRRAWILLWIILCYSWIARLLLLDFSWGSFCADWPSWIMVAVEAGLLLFAAEVIRKGLGTTGRCLIATALVFLTAVLQIAFHSVPPSEFASRLFYFYRSEHLLNGVSPILPFIFLLFAMIAVISRHIQTLFAFSKALRPRLPDHPAADNTRTLLPGDKDAKEIFEACCSPWRLAKTENNPAGQVSLLLIVALTAFVFWISFHHLLETMESNAYSACFTACAAFVAFLLLYEIFWSITIWNVLNKRLLVSLERSPLRTCFSRLSGFSWRRLWFNVDLPWQARFRALARAYDSLCHIERLPDCPIALCASARTAEIRHEKMFAWVQDSAKIPADIRDSELLVRFRTYGISLSAFGSRLIGSVLLAPERQYLLSTSLDASAATCAKILDENVKTDPIQALSEEFVGLIYIHAIQQVLVDIRSHVFAFAFGYFFLLLAFNVYPVGPRHTIMTMLVILFLMFFAAVIWIFQQMNRDSILSRTTDTEPGKLGSSFWLHLGSALGVPLLGLVASQFPEISNFLYSWLQPSLQAIK